ncbi:TPA: hypothetical protein ACH3X1_012742 [Trebouxia sp. C0004]
MPAAKVGQRYIRGDSTCPVAPLHTVPLYMVVLEQKVEKVAESVSYPRHAGKIHPCAALPVNKLESETLQTWSEKAAFLERLPGKVILLRDEQISLLAQAYAIAAIFDTAQMHLYIRYQIMCHSVIPFVEIMVCW